MKTDADLVQIVDAALADATLRAGHHLVCRPGCFQCCVGAFAINALDADRLRRGARALRQQDPGRFDRVMHRVEEYVARTVSVFPGDVATGVIDASDKGQAEFEEFANDEVCPVLDPTTGTCDLYDYRPMTCRVFGPPVRADFTEAEEAADPVNGLGVCELCFTGASPDEIAAAELIPDPEDVEGQLLQRVPFSGQAGQSTVIAYALSTRIGAKEL